MPYSPFSRFLAPSPSSSWRSFSCSLSCSRKIAPDSDARAELIRVSETKARWSGQSGFKWSQLRNGELQVARISGQQFSEAEAGFGNHHLNPCSDYQHQVILQLSCSPVFSRKLFRPLDDDPGLQEAEGGFIRLLDRLTNGSQVKLAITSPHQWMICAQYDAPNAVMLSRWR